jgi:hypothetical protein
MYFFSYCHFMFFGIISLISLFVPSPYRLVVISSENNAFFVRHCQNLRIFSNVNGF